MVQVGWAHADMAPGMMLGQDENSWAFDGYNVSLSSRLDRNNIDFILYVYSLLVAEAERKNTIAANFKNNCRIIMAMAVTGLVRQRKE